MGEHANPRDKLVLPRTKVLRLGQIAGVHPAVQKGRGPAAPEPLVGLRDVKEENIRDTLEVPRIAVVPTPDRNKYWVWSGIRIYLRLVHLKWPNGFPVLNYGLEMPEKKIVDLARADLRFAAIFSGQSAESDRSNAREWEADTANICRPAKPGSRRRPDGLKVYADLRGLRPRSLRADKRPKAGKSKHRSGSATNDEQDGES